MKDRYGNNITKGSTFKVTTSRLKQIGESGTVQEVHTRAKPPYLVGLFVDNEPVMQIGIGKPPVVDMELTYPMTLYAGDIEIQQSKKGES